MRRFALTLLLLIAFPAMLQAADQLPIALLFPVQAREGASTSLAASATQAIKEYLRGTGKMDVATFDSESPIVKRALLEHRITTQDLLDDGKVDTRMKLCKLIGTDYAVSGDIVVLKDKVNMGVWIGDVKINKMWPVSASSEIADFGNKDRAISNAMQSTASTLIWQLASEVLKDVKPKPQVNPNVKDDSDLPPTEDTTLPAKQVDDASLHVAKAEQFIKDKDDANAIIEYKAAINFEPKNIELRLKLAGLYDKRKMFEQAIDELNRASELAPENDDIRKQLAAVYLEKGSPEKSVLVFKSYADKHPEDLSSRIATGDQFWKQNMFDKAEEEYKAAAVIDKKSPLPHERIAMILAAQSMFTESKQELEVLQTMDTQPAQATQEARYKSFRSYIDPSIATLMDQYDSATKSFAAKEVTREYYYDFIDGISLRFDSIAKFLDTMAVPSSSTSIHKRKVLGCSLMSQACARMESYLESNKASEREEASILVNEARKHLTAN